MQRFIRLVAFGTIALLLFDATFSIASRLLALPDASAVWASSVIYGTTGFAVSRHYSVAKSALAGAILGFANVTLGGVVSAVLRANDPTRPELTAATWTMIAITVVISGLMCAGLGGVIGRVTRKLVDIAA